MAHVTGGKKFWDLRTELSLCPCRQSHLVWPWEMTQKDEIPLFCSLPMAPSQYKMVFVAQSLGLEDSREYADLGFRAGESCKEQGVGLNPYGFLPSWDLWFWSVILQLWNDLGTAIWSGQITSKQWKHWRKLLLTVQKKNCCSIITALLSQHNGLPYRAVTGWDAGCSALLWEADSLKLCIKLFPS